MLDLHWLICHNKVAIKKHLPNTNFKANLREITKTT